MVKTAIFLGAGASKAEGAPLQGELFKAYFSSPRFRPTHNNMDRELTSFFFRMFGIDVEGDDLSKVDFPTFEEVLGLADLAILRKEAFRNFNLDKHANTGCLRSVGQSLVYLVAKVLHEKLRGRMDLHRTLVRTLHDAGVLQDATFISTNYDILIDNALTELYDDVDLDYGVDFRNFELINEWKRPRSEKAVKLFKPHGSLNWLFCPTCNYLKITPKEKAVVTRLISQYRHRVCPECHSAFSPLIVPPTFYKDLNNVFLSSIWNRTEKALREADHIVFCGYSFPDSDIHIKYLLKRAQTNRHDPQVFTVVNDFPTKTDAVREEEQYRYKRFIGQGVDYTKLSFEKFATNPFATLF